MNCTNCGIEFEGRADAKYCSSRCRKEAFSKRSVGTDNGTDIVVAERIIPETFQFTIKVGKSNAPDIKEAKERIRTAKYWYEVPIAAVPVIKKGWPQMPEYMNGRQYFLWWKNEFKEKDGRPEIHNPYPQYDKLTYYQAGDNSRRWGA